MDRRSFVSGVMAAGTVLGARGAFAQHQHNLPAAPPSASPFSRLQGGAMVPALTPEQEAQRSLDSRAPAGPPGRWVTKAALPIPRSEMAWATSWEGRMHIVGGYGEGRVDRAYHHVYDPDGDRWLNAAPLPRGANHVSVCADAGRVYALGGFTEQNRNPDQNAYAYEVANDRWVPIAPLTRARGAGAAVAFGGKIYLIGGGSAPTMERSSVGWNEVYDPQADRWTQLKALPGARDHVGVVAHEGKIHIVGGRFNTFEYNTDLHHVYFPDRDTWEPRAPLPTARSGLGMVIYRNRFFTMGGEHGIQTGGGQFRQATVYGQMESYDPATDTWQHHATMPTPRHAVGAAVLGDWIHVAGGGPVLGGALQSAVHEAFTLS